jgi:hypothetical protein
MCRRERRPIPPQIANAPRLRPGLELFYHAFEDLNSERQIGFGSIGRIPWSAIEAWADRHELPDDLREELHFVLRKMDKVFVDHCNEQNKKR